MKKTIFLALLAAAFAVRAADTQLRVDIDGIGPKIGLTGEGGANMAVSPMPWIKDAALKQNTLYAVTNGNIPADAWNTCRFSFTPAQSGNLTFQIKGQWAPKAEDYGWLLVNRLEINGELMANGDFRRLEAVSGNGKTLLSGFWLGAKARYLDVAGDNETPAVLVNFENPLCFTLPVEAGKKYEIGIKAKAADPAQFVR